VVEDLSSLLKKIDELQQTFQSPVMVEEFVAGREFYVGVLGNASVQAFPVIELDFSKDPDNRHRIASFDVKWSEARDQNTESVFPTDLPTDLVERMQRVAIDAFQAMRLRDYARIDLRVNDAGEIFVIEVNPNCYLEQKSEFARAAEKGGLGYDALIARIVELAAARYAR
jgi:D-alanine-D-alanine ligase